MFWIRTLDVSKKIMSEVFFVVAGAGLNLDFVFASFFTF